MSLYYIVKLYQADPRANPDYLGERTDHHGKETKLGVVHLMGAKRFLWSDEAFKGLKSFMDEHGGDRIVRGQVFHVREEAVEEGHVGEQPKVEEPPPPPPAVKPGSAQVDIDTGEEMLAAAEAVDMNDDSDHDDWHEAALYFMGEARDLLDAAKERDELLKRNKELHQRLRNVDDYAQARLEEVQRDLARIAHGIENTADGVI